MCNSLAIEDSFNKLKDLIKSTSKESNFIDSSNKIDSYIKSLDKDDFIMIVKQIGTIPEEIEHDSSEEKLFSKASDSVLSRCFRELGLKSKVLTERGDSADIVANSIHRYSLVAAKELNRRYIGFEKEEKYYALACERLDLNKEFASY